jgi:hypothetical protein
MNETDKARSIEYIITRGLAKPQSLPARAVEMVRALGWRHIFWDTPYSLCFAALTLAAVCLLFATAPEAARFSTAVAISPLLFLLITAFAETSEMFCGLYELKQTCRYTIRQITAIRVICYSAAGAAFTAVVAVVQARDAHEFLSLFSLCLSALFVCAALELACMRLSLGFFGNARAFGLNRWASAAFSAAWVFANIALSASFAKGWEAALRSAPVAITTIVAFAGAAALAFQISKMLSEVDNHALA